HAIRGLESAKERNEIALLLAVQLRAEHQIEKLNGIVEGQQAAVVHIGRRILDASERKCLDRSVTDFTHSVDHLRLEEPLCLEVVHQVVGVVRGSMARAALALAEED